MGQPDDHQPHQHQKCIRMDAILQGIAEIIAPGVSAAKDLVDNMNDTPVIVGRVVGSGRKKDPQDIQSRQSC
jgi:hypothetical protein